MTLFLSAVKKLFKTDNIDLLYFCKIPEGEKRIDFLLSLLRMSSAERPGLLQALLGKGHDYNLDSLSISERDRIEKMAREWVNFELSAPLNENNKK